MRVPGDDGVGSFPTIDDFSVRVSDSAEKQIESRADVAAQRDRLATARKSARNSYAAYLPNLNLVAQPSFQDPVSLATPTVAFQAQLLLSFPIYDGGLRYGVIHELDALRDQASSTLKGTTRQARADVRAAFQAVARADEALAHLRTGADLADEAAKLGLQAYQAGTASNLEVVDAERIRRDAHAELAIAENNAAIARLELLAASGRFP